ncbi:MAG TPA: hypothetical protein GX506_05515, partial [Firmicutes bacterium]|nr:hypothetical protein [Bacillota bacterium]
MGKVSVTAFVIKGGDVVTPSGVLTDGFVLVQDGKIDRVGSSGEFRRGDYGGMRMIHAEGKIVAPGFIDIHVHGGGGHEFLEGDET